jgi:adenylate cyclase
LYPTIESTAHEIIYASLDVTTGYSVPKTEDVVMKNGAKKIDAVYLYADLAASSDLAQKLKPFAAAAIIRAYINSASRILRNYGGEIRSFDGDRVMAIFMGTDKVDKAVRAALAINWAVSEVLKPMIAEHWSDVEKFYKIDHGVGIDIGEALVVRGGVRDNNDLISVGAVPNVAAKLSEVRDYYSIYITQAVRDQLDESLLKFETGSDVWIKTSSQTIGGQYYTVYGSNAWWKP